MPAANVIQLRQLLKEKMPELRLSLEELPSQRLNHWPTGLSALDHPLHGGLPRGALTEISSAQRSAGSALLRNAFIARAAGENQIVGLVDGSDSFDVTTVNERILRRLLWVRSRSADEALKAADLLVRDRNVPLLLLDLVANPVAQIRRIPSTVWFRFQRLLEQGSTVCIVLTPQPMVSSAQARIRLQPAAFSLQAMDCEREALLARLKLEVADARRLQESQEPLRNLA